MQLKQLNDKENEQYEVIEKIINRQMTRKEAMQELKLSRQQIYRLINIYKNEGKEGFIHKGRGKISYKKINRQLIEELEQLYLTDYFDYNFEHFYEEIKDEYKISYPSLYREFLNDDIISPLAHKETVKLYNENMNKSIHAENGDIIEEKEELIKSRLLAYEKAHPRKSSNLYVFGQEVQMDACEKFWFGNVVSYLHLAVDKATKKVLFGWFEYEELTRGYMILLYNIIVNYGIPKRIKADNRNSFSNKKNETNTTQFGIICNELGIELITTSIPTSKANIERMNKTFKDRLIAELRHEGITKIDAANKYLNDVFIPKMNRKFSYEIDSKTSHMKQNTYSLEELDLIISEKYTRIIDNACSIKYNNKYYIPINPNTGEIMYFSKKTECKLILTYHYNYWCKIENNYYELLELENRDTIMKKESESNKTDVLERKQYIPPVDHPWRKFKL